MKSIHPELMLDSHKKVTDLADMWKKTQEIADNPEVFYKWMDNALGDDASYWSDEAKRRPERSKWEIRTLIYNTMFMNIVHNTLKRNPKVLPEALAEYTIFPIETLMKEATFPYSYHLLTRNKDYEWLCLAFGRTLTGDDGSAPDESILSHIQTHNISIFSYLAWKLAGQKTYLISEGLTDALKVTKLRQYPTELLKAPSPALYVEFPLGAFKFTTYADAITPSDTGYVSLPVEGAYILEDTSPLGMRLWRIVVVCQYTDTPSKAVHINHYYIPLYENQFVDVCLKDAIAMMKGEKVCEVPIPGNETGKIGVLSDKHNAWDKKIVDCAEEIFRFLMNVIIYITHGDADETLLNSSPEYAKYRNKMLTAQGKKRERIKAKLKTLNSGTRILLGKNYTIKRWDNDESKTAGEPTGRHINVRTLVSGHWRNQVCGVGGLERKVIWIEPFWRGPEAAPLTEKRAVVK